MARLSDNLAMIPGIVKVLPFWAQSYTNADCAQSDKLNAYGIYRICGSDVLRPKWPKALSYVGRLAKGQGGMTDRVKENTCEKTRG